MNAVYEGQPKSQVNGEQREGPIVCSVGPLHSCFSASESEC